jgi:hypothetical protein
VFSSSIYAAAGRAKSGSFLKVNEHFRPTDNKVDGADERLQVNKKFFFNISGIIHKECMNFICLIYSLNQKQMKRQNTAKYCCISFMLLITLCLTACEPRGETRSLNEIVDTAKEKFVALTQRKDIFDKMQPDIIEKVKSVASELMKILDTVGATTNSIDKTKLQESIRTVILRLTELVQYAGYTSRPALGEIIPQFQELIDTGAYTDISKVKLLVSRAFFLLGSELEGVKFGLKEREGRL